MDDSGGDDTRFQGVRRIAKIRVSKGEAMTKEEEAAAIAAICESCEENLTCDTAYAQGCIPQSHT